MEQPNISKVKNKLEEQLSQGEMEITNITEEAINQLLPIYQIPIVAKQDHIQEETRIIEQYINQTE